MNFLFKRDDEQLPLERGKRIERESHFKEFMPLAGTELTQEMT